LRGQAIPFAKEGGAQKNAIKITVKKVNGIKRWFRSPFLVEIRRAVREA